MIFTYCTPVGGQHIVPCPGWGRGTEWKSGKKNKSVKKKKKCILQGGYILQMLET